MVTGQQLAAAGKRFIGSPYVWGGRSPAGMDCSGHITLSMAAVGLQLGGNSTSQIEACRPVTVDSAWDTPGAVLWRQGHIALVVAPGRTVEALTTGVAELGRTSTYQGKPRFTRGGLLPGVHYNEEEPMASTMVSPAKGRVSSEYGRRSAIPGVTSGTFHAGIDIAAPKGTPVYAAFAGTVKDEGANVAPYRSGDRNVLIENPDGEGQYYGHLDSNVVRKGQKVKAGQLIGYVGARGNVTGPHLHFEIWANADNPASHRNPRVDFGYFGIAPGSAPKGTSKPSKPKPSKPAKPSTGSAAAKKALTASVKQALKAMGLPATVAGVERYQRAHGLYPDGVWGTVTRRYYHWVKLLQTYLNKWKNVQRHYPSGIRVDGYRGNITRAAERYARAGATKAVPYDPPKEPAKRA